jgi:hypothetical protein
VCQAVPGTGSPSHCQEGGTVFNIYTYILNPKEVITITAAFLKLGYSDWLWGANWGHWVDAEAPGNLSSV